MQGGAISCIQVMLHCIGLNLRTTPTRAVFTPPLLDHHSLPMCRLCSSVTSSFLQIGSAHVPSFIHVPYLSPTRFSFFWRARIVNVAP
uniref:Uncharacterized protein n=1 Tax=Ixodes ricinus TaxID=34613 RepID=A0A6B0U9U1_IXORI